jgi:Mrp family chromosome partitioning ATPase
MDPSASLRHVKHIILILSGKGGVGKSTVTAQLALSLASRGFRVGVLDIDICGPSIPRIFGVNGQPVHQCSDGWVPVYPDPVPSQKEGEFLFQPRQLAIMSLGFLLPSEDDAVIWRGPKKTAMIRQLLQQVYWGELDYLLIDTPPGTSDEHISVVDYLQSVHPDGAVLVTTPQQVSVTDVRKEATFCNKLGVRILGIVENMSGFVCPCCGDIEYPFSTGGGAALAAEISTQFLGQIPLDPALGNAQDSGCRSFGADFFDSHVSKSVSSICDAVLSVVTKGS